MRNESEVVRDIFKWMENKCKEQKKRVDNAEEEFQQAKRQYKFEDELCLIDSAELSLAREQGKLSAYVDAKIGIEKYMRKLKYEEAEETKIL